MRYEIILLCSVTATVQAFILVFSNYRYRRERWQVARQVREARVGREIACGGGGRLVPPSQWGTLRSNRLTKPSQHGVLFGAVNRGMYFP